MFVSLRFKTIAWMEQESTQCILHLNSREKLRKMDLVVSCQSTNTIVNTSIPYVLMRSQRIPTLPTLRLDEYPQCQRLVLDLGPSSQGLELISPLHFVTAKQTIWK